MSASENDQAAKGRKKLGEIAARLERLGRSEPVSVREMLGWFGAECRGRRVNQMIREVLTDNGLSVGPDINAGLLDDTIEFYRQGYGADFADYFRELVVSDLYSARLASWVDRNARATESRIEAKAAAIKKRGLGRTSSSEEFDEIRYLCGEFPASPFWTILRPGYRWPESEEMAKSHENAATAGAIAEEPRKKTLREIFAFEAHTLLIERDGVRWFRFPGLESPIRAVPRPDRSRGQGLERAPDLPAGALVLLWGEFPEEYRKGKRTLQLIAARLKSGKKVEPATVRELLGCFGTQRRTLRAAFMIREALERNDLRTEPDFNKRPIDGALAGCGKRRPFGADCRVTI